MSEGVIEYQNEDERLKDVFRRLMDLYERHAQERHVIIKERQEINNLVCLLVNQTKEMGQYENGIRKRIQDCIKESAHKSMLEIEQSIVDKANQSLEQSTQNMNDIYKSMERLIEDFQSEKKNFFWKICLIVFASSVFVVFLIGTMRL